MFMRIWKDLRSNMRKGGVNSLKDLAKWKAFGGSLPRPDAPLPFITIASNDEPISIFKEGMNAFKNNISLEQNPYPQASSRRRRWNDGWEFAKEYDK